jgi:hypothetical protein
MFRSVHLGRNRWHRNLTSSVFDPLLLGRTVTLLALVVSSTVRRDGAVRAECVVVQVEQELFLMGDCAIRGTVGLEHEDDDAEVAQWL